MARQRYRPRHGRQSKAELQVLLLHEELRRVYPDSAGSYYGHSYQVSPGYLKCRAWAKLWGDTLLIESAGKTIIKYKLARQACDILDAQTVRGLRCLTILQISLDERVTGLIAYCPK